jgi:hypothetical protein
MITHKFSHSSSSHSAKSIAQMAHLSRRANHHRFLSGSSGCPSTPERFSQHQYPQTPSSTRRTDPTGENENIPWSSPDGQYYVHSANQTPPLSPSEKLGFETNTPGRNTRPFLLLPFPNSDKLCFNTQVSESGQPSARGSTHNTFSRLSNGSRKLLPDVVSFLNDRRNSHRTYQTLPTPLASEIPPSVQAGGLIAHRCYYFAARNCKGWTIGCLPDDACESCRVSVHHMSFNSLCRHS